MKTRDILSTVTRILPDWHVYKDHQSGCITAFDPQAGYEVTVNLPDSDTISIVRMRYELEYELVEDVTVLNTADMGEERAKGVCDFDEFRVRIITLAADEYLDKAKGKRKQWASLCDGADMPMPESLAAVVSDMEDKANRLKALLESDDPPLLDGRDIAILKDLKPYGVVKPAEKSQRLRELGVLERRYYIDQVFDALTDKGEKALEFASHVERTKRRRTS